MSRKMASIRIIDKISPIENADRIELVTVDGWGVVAGKGSYKEGQKVIFCEIDSAIPVPDLDPDGSLAKRGTKKIDGKDYHIVRTVKLRGVYSQGLLLPLKHLKLWRRWTVKPGDDVSELLGIFKYDPFAKRATGKSVPNRDANLVGAFPTEFARKSDSERVQNLVKHWGEITEREWYVTEKLDGQSITLINDGGKLRVATRNYEVKDHPAREWAISNGFLRVIPDGVAVQGEWIGPGVNGNTLKLDGHDFLAFNVFQNGELLDGWPEWAFERRVPHYGVRLFDGESIDDLIREYDGVKSIYRPGQLAEGVVFHELNSEPVPALGGRTTFKVISNKWLVKNS